MYGQIETETNTREAILAQSQLAQSQPQQLGNKAPQVRTQVEMLAKELEAQRDTIERLYNRLEPVLSVAPPPTAEAANSRNEPTAPLAGRLCDLSRRVAAHSVLIETLLHRLEV